MKTLSDGYWQPTNNFRFLREKSKGRTQHVRQTLQQEWEYGYWGNDGHGGSEFKIRSSEWREVPVVEET